MHRLDYLSNIGLTAFKVMFMLYFYIFRDFFWKANQNNKYAKNVFYTVDISNTID